MIIALGSLSLAQTVHTHPYPHPRLLPNRPLSLLLLLTIPYALQLTVICQSPCPAMRFIQFYLVLVLDLLFFLG